MSRKLFITLILILFILPFVSWYYLQRGLTYRKEAQQIMNGTEVFPESRWQVNSSSSFSTEQLDGRVTLVTILSCDGIGEQVVILDKFYEQFKETKKASFIILDTCSASATLHSDSRSDWFVVNCKDSINSCDPVFKLWPPGKSYALLDRNIVIRSYYPGRTEDEKRMLLEHMALLIPRERSEKVELKRGVKK